ncbi:MAG: GldG family protein [Puniceicoccales bacterium]|jgi:hypothetical protein|nr:GldG family protein [Puniceicoccales bacterium]
MNWKCDDFKNARRWNGINRALQVVLAVSLAVALNYLASQSSVHRRWEIGSTQNQTLAVETQKAIESIARRAPRENKTGEPWVRIYSTLSETGWSPEQKDIVSMLRGQLDLLLDDFYFAAGKTPPEGWLRIEHTDHLKNPGVLNRYPEITEHTVLVVACKDRHKLINIADFFRIHEDGVIDAFKGEDVLISALLEVTDEKPQIIYHTTGHGEMSPADANGHGLSSLALRLRVRNILLRPLELAKVNEVPTDANLVLVPAPRTAFSPPETEKLRRYMRERNGRLIAFVDAGTNPRLDDLFYDWGIIVDDAQVVDTHAELDVKGNMLVRIGIPPSSRADAQTHELTKLLDGRALAVTRARPARFDMGSQIDETLKVTELVATTRAAAGNATHTWGERTYRKHPFVNNPELGDIPGPVSIAAVAERAAGRKMNLKISGGRMLVLGSGDITANALINEANANAFFLLNAVNWMLDRDQYLNIPPRLRPDYQLGAGPSDLSDVAWRFTLLPLALLLLGSGVFLWRRNM